MGKHNSNKKVQHKTYDDLAQFEQLYNQYSLLSNMQIQGESIYAGRTGVITIAQGLLLSVFGTLSSAECGKVDSLRQIISFAGGLLSILWYFFEQRNRIYYNARGSILADIENRLVKLGNSLDVEFTRFWTEVGIRVRNRARWYQKFSAPLILRALVPMLFIATWFAAFIVSTSLIDTILRFVSTHNR